MELIVNWNLDFEDKKKKEIFFKKLVRLKRSCTFAAAYRGSLEDENGKRIYKVRYVHRHIGLTA